MKNRLPANVRGVKHLFQETLHQLLHFDVVQMFSRYEATATPDNAMFMANYWTHPELVWPSRNPPLEWWERLWL